MNLSILFLLFVQTVGLNQQLDTNIVILESDSDTLSVQTVMIDTLFNLPDTITNDSMLRNIFYPFYQIKQQHIESEIRIKRSNLPTIKEISNRKPNQRQWKFWVICFILIYIAFVRIANPNNFKVFMISVFNLKLSQKIWSDQKGIFGFVTVQLFTVFLLVGSLFIYNLLESSNKILDENYFGQFMLIFGILIIVYLLKFLLHTILAYLLKVPLMGLSFVYNTVFVNSFVALSVFPLVIFLLYNNSYVYFTIISQTIIGLFFVSIFYRMTRIYLLGNQLFNLPRFYLFIYLCALEVLPWFVIVKIINTYQI